MKKIIEAIAIFVLYPILNILLFIFLSLIQLLDFIFNLNSEPIQLWIGFSYSFVIFINLGVWYLFYKLFKHQKILNTIIFFIIIIFYFVHSLI